MRSGNHREQGRADPLGLLILAVVLALTVTMGIQAQVSAGGGMIGHASTGVCDAPCLTVEMQH